MAPLILLLDSVREPRLEPLGVIGPSETHVIANAVTYAAAKCKTLLKDTIIARDLVHK